MSRLTRSHTQHIHTHLIERWLGDNHTLVGSRITHYWLNSSRGTKYKAVNTKDKQGRGRGRAVPSIPIAPSMSIVSICVRTWRSPHAGKTMSNADSNRSQAHIGRIGPHTPPPNTTHLYRCLPTTHANDTTPTRLDYLNTSILYFFYNDFYLLSSLH